MSTSLAEQWLPSREAHMLLRQMGVPSIDIIASITAFRGSDSFSDLSTIDKRFVRFVVNKNAPAIIKKQGISLEWTPDETTINRLLSVGFWRDHISDLVGVFIIEMKEHGKVVSSWNDYFFGYAQKRLPKPGRVDNIAEWSPGEQSLYTASLMGFSKRIVLSHVTDFMSLAKVRKTSPELMDQEFCNFLKNWYS